MEDYLAFAEKIALEAGSVMLKYFKMGVESKEKVDKTVVTRADEEINKLVIKKVEDSYPNTSVQGEEASLNKSSKMVWVCDPVDGTEPFSKGIPISVFSLALVDDGKPVLGVVYDPFMKRLYKATSGNGAFLNNKKLKVSDKPLSVRATVDVEWWPEASWDADTAMHNLSMDTATYVLHLGSIIQAGCLVAAGQYEACIFTGGKGKNMDIAALKVIIEEAGGKVTDLFGNEQRYDGTIKGAIVSNGVVHDEILKYTKDL